MTSVEVLPFFKQALIWDFGIAAVAYVFAAFLQTEKFFDLVATSTLVFLTGKSLQWGGAQYPRQYIQSACAVLWAIRLGLFLFTRVMRKGGEKGFDGVRDNPAKFLVAWIGAGVWTICNVTPTLIQNVKDASAPIGTLEYVGWGMWCLGFIIEWTADYQKTVFRARPENKEKYITSGLWRLSRHPNYFGEMMMWSGLYLSAFNILEGWEHLSIISPLFPVLLMTQVTALALEKDGMAHWGEDSKYLSYIARTPFIIPSPFNLLK